LYSQIYSLSRLLFLDRDNTLIKDDGYFNDPDNIIFLESNFSIFKTLNALNIGVVIVSNQSCISIGKHTVDTVLEVNSKIRTKIELEGGKVLSSFICPHSSKSRCTCRKPKSGMLLTAMKLYDVHVKDCLFIGDKKSDELSAKSVNMPFAFVQESGVSQLARQWIKQ
jgi:D-glycero-D-manno-heptose 1,7-bisphosphate phosphatase